MTTIERPARSADVTIELAAWKGNEAEPAGLQELIAKFQAEHPDIAIELTYNSRIDMEVELPNRLDGGDAPDVAMMDSQIAAPLVQAGQLRNLGTDSAWFARLSPELRADLAFGDEIFIMPAEVIGMGNFVNRSLLAEVGIDEPPTSIDDLTDACRRLSDAGIKPMVFTGQFSAALFLLAQGIESTGTPVVALGSGDERFVDSDSFNSGLDAIRELIDAECFDPTEQAGIDPWSTGLSLFADGEVAMMPHGAWNISAFAQREGLDFEFTPIPSNLPTGTTIDVFGFGFSIPRDAAHPAEGKMLIDWLARPEHIQVILEAEAAYTPFDDGSSGTPHQTRLFDEARSGGAAITYPIATGAWPTELESAMWGSLTAFLLDPTMSNSSVLERWDTTVALSRMQG